MITSIDYDKRIIAGGLQHLIDSYYAPVDAVMRKRVRIVMELLQAKPGEKILDIGCGPGTFAYHCARNNSFSTGIDYSRESIKAAKELCRQFVAENNTEFVIADACRLPFKDACFDKAVCADFIEHITYEQKEASLDEASRVLKMQGMMVILTPNGIREKIGNWYWRMRRLIFGDKVPATDLHFGLTTKNEFEKLCEKHGLAYKLYYRDITRGYIAKIPYFRRFLALNLLWVVRKENKRL